MGSDLEAVQKLAQKYVAANPVLILGSGASVPHGMPSMWRLSELLLKQVDSNEDDWGRFRNRLEQDGDFEAALHAVELSIETLATVVNKTWSIVNEADLALFADLLANETPPPLVELLEHLVRTAGRTAAVVTTNYDRLAEYSACLAGAEPFTGFSPGWIQQFVATSPERGAPLRVPGLHGRVDIWKVHGSLDWFVRPSGEVLSVPGIASLPVGMTPLIVTPGVTKYREVHREPFRSVMTRSDEVLRAANSFLCIGYGFNDEHVQPALLQRVRKSSVPAVVITKQLTDATKKSFLDGSCKKFLLLEKSEDGTRAYLPGDTSGVNLAGSDLWSLRGFFDAVVGQQETQG